MKFSGGIVTLGLIVASAVAQEPTAYIVTRLHVKEPLNATAIAEIKADVAGLKPELDQAVTDIVSSEEVGARNLRTARQLCVNCPNIAPSYPICFVNGVPKDRCDRELLVHTVLTDEEIFNLSPTELDAYLKRVEICDAAKTSVKNELELAIWNGALIIPEGASFVEQCIYA